MKKSNYCNRARITKQNDSQLAGGLDIQIAKIIIINQLREREATKSELAT